MTDYKSIDEKITLGYEYLMKGNVTVACDTWLNAWSDIKQAIEYNHFKKVDELQDKYQWSDFLLNYVQELEAELHNAGLSNKEYYQKRILYCEELLELCEKDDTLMIGNTRRAIADSYFTLGDKDKCDQLYSMWLDENPDWGWGYIGWSDCYLFEKSKDSSSLEKAREILEIALSREHVSERMEIIGRAIDLYEKTGKHQEAAELKKEFRISYSPNPFSLNNVPVRSEKIGRNDPCPCGSGKKYKKCCGK